MNRSYITKIMVVQLLASWTCGIANANLSNNAEHNLVIIPNISNQYEINASILLLQPSSTSLDYGIRTQPLPIFSPNWVIQSINPDYQAGFNIGVAYVFPQSANDLQLMWSYLNQSKSGEDNDASPNFIGPFFEIGPDANTMHSLKGHSKFKYNLINLDMGQFVNFGYRLQTRLFTGLSSIWLTQHLTATYSGDSVDPSFSMTTDNISKYAGLGPRFGIASTYHFSPKFSLVTQIAGNAYIGRIRTSLESVGTSAVLANVGIPSNPQSINADNTTRLVPGVDGNLGLNYSFKFDRKTLMKTEIGYQFATYFNAIREVYPSTLAEVAGLITPIQRGGIFVGTMGQSQSNFAVNGPYLKGAVKF